MFWPMFRHKFCRKLFLGLLAIGLTVPWATAMVTLSADQQSFIQTVLIDVKDEFSPGLRTAKISAHFLGRSYQADTLGGGPDQPEMLEVDFDSVDCFTLLDYVEALRRSTRVDEFIKHLLFVRYRDSEVSWTTRRHFLTDWAYDPGTGIRDVTAEIGGRHTRQTIKQINRRDDDKLYVPGIAVHNRTVYYIPVSAIAPEIVIRLKTGDYLGIYSTEPGLDVSHTGIVIRRNGQLFLRHASSQPGQNQVIDSPLICYLTGKPGIVILRPE